MSDALQDLYGVVCDRREHPQEGSYTCYLFEKGLDKILKKIGEEAAEVIIAAKGGSNADTTLEICDVLYHLTVLMAERGIPMSDVLEELERRSLKIGNLKQLHASDHNT